MEKPKKTCVICGKEFTPGINPRQMCCSIDCTRVNSHRSQIKRRRSTPHVCPVCGKVFHASSGRVYCSERCKRNRNNAIRDAKNKKPPKEPEVGNTCPEDCMYRIKLSFWICDYLLMEGEPRGCDITNCDKYKPVSGKRPHGGWKPKPVF